MGTDRTPTERNSRGDANQQPNPVGGGGNNSDDDDSDYDPNDPDEEAEEDAEGLASFLR